MSSDVLIVGADSPISKLSVIGVDISVLSTKEKANGQEITLQKGEEGMGPPPHNHAWDESFYVLSGAIEFFCNGQSRVCGEGTFVHIPAGTLHAFTFMEGGGQMLEITHNGQAVQAFTAIDETLPKGPPDIEQAVRVFGENGVNIALGEPG
jgi:quercetin dioxygenase-like cupin family protein